MLVGYDANNVMRNSTELGDFCRGLVEKMAQRHVSDYRALLFSTRIKSAYKTYFTSFANVSTFVPQGTGKLMPSMWLRYSLNPWLQFEKVKVFHGLNGELPYRIGRDVKTIVTCYGLENHHKTSLLDSLMWKSRMRYSFRASDVIVTVSDEVKRQLVEAGVNGDKVIVIGTGNPYELTDQMVEQYFELYKKLAE